MGCRSMNKVDSRPSIPRLPSIGRFQDAKILSIDGKMTSISKHCGAKAVTARCKSAMASNETDTQIVPMGASVMGLFCHSLSIFGGDYVICRIFLQSTRIVVITRAYEALPRPAWVGIRGSSHGASSPATIEALEGELFVGTRNPTITSGGDPPPSSQRNVAALSCRAAKRVPGSLSELHFSHQLAFGLADELRESGFIAGPMKQDEPIHAGVGEALCGVAVDSATGRDADLQIFEAPPSLLAGGAEAVDTLARCLNVERESEPPLRKARGTAECLWRGPAENNLGMRFLYGARHRIDAAERNETPVIFRLLHRPQRDHCGEELLAARSLMIEGRADRVEFGFEVADSDTEDEPAAGQNIHRGKLLGQHHRIALRQYDSTRAEP